MIRKLPPIILLLSLVGCSSVETMVFRDLQQDVDIDVCFVYKGPRHASEFYREDFNSNKSPFFRSVVVAASVKSASNCDLAVLLEITGMTYFSPDYGNAYSAYTGEKLLRVRAKGQHASRKIGRAIYDSFQKGSPLYKKIIGQREAYARAQPSRSSGKRAAVARAASVLGSVGPNYQMPPNNEDFALVIGIEDYKDLPDAKFAEHDASAVAAHMAALGIPRRHIIHLSGSDASFSSIRKYLDSWLPRNVKPSSRVYFYFSGHGAPDIQSGKAYLVPWDGDASFLDSTAHPIEKLYASLNKLNAKDVIVVLDACFSGAGGRSVLAEGARPLVTKVDMGKDARGKLILLTAASGNEITTTHREEKHGIFTYFFLKGLNGAATDRKGRVTVKSLYEYLKPKVQDEARLQNRDQTPTIQYGKDVVLRAR